MESLPWQGSPGEFQFPPSGELNLRLKQRDDAQQLQIDFLSSMVERKSKSQNLADFKEVASDLIIDLVDRTFAIHAESGGRIFDPIRANAMKIVIAVGSTKDDILTKGKYAQVFKDLCPHFTDRPSREPVMNESSVVPDFTGVMRWPGGSITVE